MLAYVTDGPKQHLPVWDEDTTASSGARLSLRAGRKRLRQERFCPHRIAGDGGLGLRACVPGRACAITGTRTASGEAYSSRSAADLPMPARHQYIELMPFVGQRVSRADSAVISWCGGR